MTWSVSANVEEYDEAVEAFRKRVPITRAEADRVNNFSHSRGFTLAGVAQLDVVQDVHASIEEAIKKGTPFAEWKKSIEAALTAAWGRENSPRLETIFRNATMQSYNAGRRRQMLEPTVLKFRPFWMFDGVADQRQTEICRDCNGTVLPADHPWWNSHTPQLHHRCRSSVRNMRAADADRIGVTASPPDAHAAMGFGAPPDTAEPWKPDLSKYSPQLLAAFGRKLEQLKAAPSPELAPTAPLRLKAKAFAKALELKDEGWEARALLREQIQHSFPGAIPRNFANAGKLVAAPISKDPGLRRENAYYEPSHCKNAGRIVVRAERMKQAKKAAQALASTGDMSAEQADYVRTLFHEELHGHSRVTGRSYVGLGRLFEEVGTELAARKVIEEIAPGSEKAGVFRAYGAEIKIVADAVRVAAGGGTTLEQAKARILKAHVISSLTRAGEWSSAIEAVGAFLDALDLTPEARQTLHSTLLAEL